MFPILTFVLLCITKFYFYFEFYFIFYSLTQFYSNEMYLLKEYLNYLCIEEY